MEVEAANESSSNVSQSTGQMKIDRDKLRKLLNSMGRSDGRLGMSTSWLREVLEDSSGEEDEAAADCGSSK